MKPWGSDEAMPDLNEPVFVYERERNMPEYSEFFATFWDQKAGKFRTEKYGEWPYTSGGARVNATQDIMDAWKAIREETDLYVRSEQDMIDRHDPQPGKLARSLTTRGKACGVVGKIFWRGANQFRTYYRNGYNHPESPDNQVVGIEANGTRVFVPLKKVEVITL